MHVCIARKMKGWNFVSHRWDRYTFILMFTAITSLGYLAKSPLICFLFRSTHFWLSHSILPPPTLRKKQFYYLCTELDVLPHANTQLHAYTHAHPAVKVAAQQCKCIREKFFFLGGRVVKGYRATLQRWGKSYGMHQDTRAQRRTHRFYYCCPFSTSWRKVGYKTIREKQRQYVTYSHTGASCY